METPHGVGQKHLVDNKHLHLKLYNNGGSNTINKHIVFLFYKSIICRSTCRIHNATLCLWNLSHKQNWYWLYYYLCYSNSRMAGGLIFRPTFIETGNWKERWKKGDNQLFPRTYFFVPRHFEQFVQIWVTSLGKQK